MTGYEFHDLLAGNRELISDTWNFFLTVHLALLGIIFVSRDGINNIQRIVLFGAYVAFMYMNYAAQIDNYTHYLSIVDGIRSMPATSQGAAEAKAMVTMDPVWIVDYLGFVYLAATIACGAIIALIRREQG